MSAGAGHPKRAVLALVWIAGALAVAAAIADHREHVLGAVPYLLLLLCPVVHLFIHHHHHNGPGHREDDVS